jgi:diacylglycerol O-acyltransferase / wax synthase
MPPERLSSLDASFLYLERPAMHMHVAGVSVFTRREDGPLTYEDVAGVSKARMHLAPRLRQRVLSLPGGLTRPIWVDDDHFDLDFHLRRAAIPQPGGRLQLERAVGRVLSRPLDRNKPLWELYVFEGLEDERTAVLLKMHHALADGISGMLIASALFDLSPDTNFSAPTVERWVPDPLPSRADLATEALQDLVLHPMEAIVRIAQAPAHAVAVVGQTLEGLRSIVGMGAPPQGPFDVRVGPNRRFATAEVPFKLVHDVKRALGGTINDLVLAAVAGGLHDVLDARGGSTRGRVLRVMVPVSVRSKAEQGDVGNRVAPAFVDIPVGAMKPTTRLKRVRAATGVLKSSEMAVSADSIIGLGAYAPPALHAMAARLVSRNRWFNLVVSNIPAPQVPMYLAGAQLVASYPAMPLGENCALSIACTSFGGTMAFGLTADWDALPDIDVLARGIERSFQELADAQP